MNDELYINGVRVDLDASTNFAFSFSINDVKEPDKRSRSVSKSITLPGTQNNLNTFYSAYSLPQHYDPINPIGFDFDPRVSYEAKYYINNQLRFVGFAQIVKTKILNGVVNFDIILFSNIVNFINQFGDIKISELGWDEYEHTLNHDNISNSWDTSVIVDGVATSNFTAGLPDGFGYYYGLIDYGFGGVADEYADNRLFPLFYQREIMIKAFDFLGYTIDGDFIDSTMFKKALLGIGGGDPIQLTSAELAARLVDLTITKNINEVFVGFDFANIITGDPIRNWLTPILTSNFGAGAAVVSDTKGQYSSPSIQVASNGNYRLIINGDIDYDFLVSGTGAATFNTANLNLQILINGSPQLTEITQIVTSPTVSNNIVGTATVSRLLDIPLVGGDEVTLRLRADCQATQTDPSAANLGTLTIDLDTTLFDFEMQATNGELSNQDTVNLAVFAPDLKVADFVSSVIKQYNLQVDEPTDLNVVNIEPLEDYYGSTSDADDWTYKQDLTKEIEIDPIALTQPKIYAYNYADDNDYYHALYKSNNEIQYGNFQFDNPTLFTKGKSEIKLPYTVTPLVDISGTDLTIPRIIKVENSIVNPYKGKPRIYYVNPMQTGSWTLVSTNVGAETDTTYATYPLAHHLDDIDSPTIDLCFGTPIEVFYIATAYTTSNLFQTYFRRFINEYTSIDGRLLTSYFKLDEGDFIGNFFSKLKKINGIAYRLNKINDTVLNSGVTSQVELVKVLESKSPRNYTITPPTLATDNDIRELTFGDTDTGDTAIVTVKSGVLEVDGKSTAGSAIYITEKADFPTPESGVIVLEDGMTYIISGNVDLDGDRISCNGVVNLFGLSSETSSLTSDRLTAGVPLITSTYTIVIENLTIKDVDTAISIDGNTREVALDWENVNFSNVINVGTIDTCDNFIYETGAFLNSQGLVMTGTIGTVSFSNSLFVGRVAAGSIIELDASCVITRRFRIIYSSLVIDALGTGIDVNASATIPTESYILDTCNFAGAGTYLNGVVVSSNDALFIACKGIKNSAVNGQLYMQDNATATTIVNTTDFVKIAGTTTASSDNQKYIATDNRLTNNAVIQRKYLVQATLTFTAGNNNVCEFGFYDSKLAAIRTPSRTKSTANSAGRAENITLSCVVQHSDGDYIEVHARNTSATTDIVGVDLNLIITEII